MMEPLSLACCDLFPQIIGVGSPALILRTVLFEYAGEDVEIAWRHIDDLKANIIKRRVEAILRAPPASRTENHVCLVGNISGKLDAEKEVLILRDWPGCFQLETTRADIGQMSNQFSGVLVHHSHIV